MPQPSLTVEQKYAKHVAVGASDECWEHDYAGDRDGYAQVYDYDTDRKVLLHRWVYEKFVGPIPEGMLACHSCDNTRCCNHHHLFLGTAKDNSVDMVRKGRSSFGERNGRAKLTSEDVTAIRIRYSAGSVSQQSLADQYGVSQLMISKIVRHESWAA